MANAMMVRFQNWIAGLRDREEGQGLVEYVVLIGLIAVGVMVAVGLFEDSISNTFGEIGSRISDLP